MLLFFNEMFQLHAISLNFLMTNNVSMLVVYVKNS